VVVCEVVVPELVVPELVVIADDVLLEVSDVDAAFDAEVEELVPDVVAPVALVLAAAVCVAVALCPSRHAITPPRESIAATLSAAAALRALAARGLRRPSRRVGTRGGVLVGVGACASMSTTVRIADEGLARTG
jgi:hypothetical protein